jgi:hypothetical protein
MRVGSGEGAVRLRRGIAPGVNGGPARHHSAGGLSSPFTALRLETRAQAARAAAVVPGRGRRADTAERVRMAAARLRARGLARHKARWDRVRLGRALHGWARGLRLAQRAEWEGVRAAAAGRAAVAEDTAAKAHAHAVRPLSSALQPLRLSLLTGGAQLPSATLPLPRLSCVIAHA